MSENWKPGDVITATVEGRPNVRLVAGWSKYDPQLRWCELSPRWADGDDDECWFMPSRVTDPRRLVAIDPEDREQVERFREIASRLADDVPYDADEHAYTDAMQSALREFANPTPPKPTEPHNLGARVTDRGGLEWAARTGLHPAPDGMGLIERRWGCLNGSATDRTWDDLCDERGPLTVEVTP